MDNGWEKYQMLVLEQLHKHNEKIDHMAEDISKLKTEIEKLKIKIAFYIVIIGIAASGFIKAIPYIYDFFK